jgi:hypothetical protein
MIYEFIEGQDPWGRDLKNGSASGATGKAQRGEVQIAMGSLYFSFTANNFVECSFSEFFVISPAKKISSLEKLLIPFNYWTWMAISFTLLIAFLVIYLIKRRHPWLRNLVVGTGVQNPTINILIAIFGLGQTKLPEQNFGRFLLMSFLILCLILRTGYQGALFNFLQSDQRAKIPESIDELAELGFDLYAYICFELHETGRNF